MATKKMPPYPIFGELDAVPENMYPWGITFDNPIVNPNYGYFYVSRLEECPLEQHHTVEVIDENDDPLWGVWVIFGFPGQPQNLGHLSPKVNYWQGAPAVLSGNAQRTGFDGYVQHTTGQTGGEDIWVWYVVPNPAQGNRLELYLSSVTVKGCQSITVDGRPHRGVHVVFKRQMNLANVMVLPTA